MAKTKAKTKTATNEAHARQPSIDETAGATAASKPSTNELWQGAPPKLEMFDGDTVGFCDPETGVCAVPRPVPPEAARVTEGKRGEAKA